MSSNAITVNVAGSVALTPNSKLVIRRVNAKAPAKVRKHANVLITISFASMQRRRGTGNARTGEHPLKFDVKATMPVPPLERQNIPTEFTLDAPGLLSAPVAGKSEVRLNGNVVQINGLSGMFGDGAFNGWASVDIASKPLVKLDLDFHRLNVAMAKSATGSAKAPWSNDTINLTGLNYVDGQARIVLAYLLTVPSNVR